MNRIDVSGPPWLLDVAEPSDQATLASDVERLLRALPLDAADLGEGHEIAVVVRAVDDRCDELLEPLGLVPDHDRWIQACAGPVPRSDFAVRPATVDDLGAITKVYARSRSWGERTGPAPSSKALQEAIDSGRLWVHDRRGRLTSALLLAPHDTPGVTTIAWLAVSSADDDPYTGPKADLERALALQTLKATLWTLLGSAKAPAGAPTSHTSVIRTATTEPPISEVRVSVAANDPEGTALFEAAKLRYRYTDRFYRRSSTRSEPVTETS